MNKTEIKKIQEIWIKTMNNCELYEKEGDTKKLLNEIGVLKGLYYIQESFEMNICLYRHFEHYISIQNKETYILKSKIKEEKYDKATKYQNILCSLPEEMIKQLDNISKDLEMTRIGIIRLLLSEGIRTYYNYIERR